MRGVCVVVLMTMLWLLSSTASAAMIVQGYSPARHDRFYEGADKAFLGEPFDFSGVGRVVDSPGWATLIAPNVFISANHFHPDIADTVRFYPTNDAAWYKDYTVVSGTKIGTSDLWVGVLNAPAVIDVAVYPIAPPGGNAEYAGDLIYTFGQASGGSTQTRVRTGANEIDPSSFASRTISGSTGMSFQYDYDEVGGVGMDESLVQGGDSGAPSFTIIDGKPALVGIHWYTWEYALTGDVGSGDTFVPAYVDDLSALLSSINPTPPAVWIPEPASLALLGLMLANLSRRSRGK